MIDKEDPATEKRKKDWGKRIRALRRDQLGMSREQLGEEVGVSSNAIGRYETGEIYPKPDTFYQLLELAKGYGALWEFTGADLPKIYRSMLKDHRLIPPEGEGVLAFLEIEVAAPVDFIDVLNLIHRYTLKFFRFGSPGEDEEGKANAYVLFVARDEKALTELRRELLDKLPIDRVNKFGPPSPEPVKEVWK